MSKKKISLLVVSGIRSQHIKIAAMQQMLKDIEKSKVDGFSFTFVDVGQHYSPTLSDNFIDELNIHFDHRFKHAETDSNYIFGSILFNLCKLIDDYDSSFPIDYVVVYGDVATTAIASIAAIIKRKKLIHIEAGERHNALIGLEESCRYIADQAADILFATTKRDYLSLLHDASVNSKHICFSGDVVYDYIKRKTLVNCSSFQYIFDNRTYEFDFSEHNYSLVSLHHLENLSEQVLSACFETIKTLNTKVVFIAHPRVRILLELYNINTKDIILVDQIPYLQILIAIKNAKYIITDSGGIQKEAYYLNKRCVVRSDEIVWESLISIGANIKIGKSKSEFLRGIQWLKENSDLSFEYEGEFGDGNAMETILDELIKIEWSP